MSKTAKLAALAGLALAAGVIIWLGAGHIFGAIVRIGWLGLFYVVAWQLVVFAAQGAAWRIACPGGRLGVVIWARLVREGAIACLPFSGVGGLALGARTVVLGGMNFATAAASIVVDILAEGASLIPFLLFGLVMLLARKPGSAVALPVALGAAILIAGFSLLILLRRKALALLHAVTAWLLEKCVKEGARRARDLQGSLQALLHRRGRIAGCVLAHFACWVLGAGNTWIGYHLLGAKPTVLDALAIEAVFSAGLGLSFLVPAGIGLQELTYAGIGLLFGLPAPISLALSLLRRARDILIGAPALFAWQIVEARNARLP